LPLLDMPAVRHPVSLLRAGAGARAPLRSAHRRLRVGRQDPRDPPLPELRLCLALDRYGSRGRRDGRQRAPDGPGCPGLSPRAVLCRLLAELREVPRKPCIRGSANAHLSVFSHVTGLLPERCVSVTCGHAARCSFWSDEGDRRPAEVLTCWSKAPTTTKKKASRAVNTPVPSRSSTRRPSLCSRSARSKTEARASQKASNKRKAAMDTKRRRRLIERLNALDTGITEEDRKAERQAMIERTIETERALKWGRLA
jgi:hypothetical protein